MFKPYIYKIAIRYFFSKDKKTIVNRINGFAFFMILSAACVLLLVLSGFAGLKDFGLTYTSSFEPDLKIIPNKGSYFMVSKEKLVLIEKIKGVCIDHNLGLHLDGARLGNALEVKKRSYIQII